MDAVHFVETHSSRLIRNCVRRACDTGQSALVQGIPGIGKTTTFQRIAEEDERARLITATPASASVKSFLSAVADAFSIHTSREHAGDIERTLWARLQRDLVLRGYYLIVDEVQSLHLEALKTAMALIDQTKLTIICGGNREVLKRTRASSASMAQIESRLFYQVHLDAMTREDIVAFAVNANVEGREANDFLVSFGLKASLREVAVLLQEARRAAGAKGSLRLPHLEQALAFMRGPDAARRIRKETASVIPIDGKPRS